MLAVVRVEEAERTAFEAVFGKVVDRLQALYGSDRVRWYDLLRIILTWAAWYWPDSERKDWWKMAETIQPEAERQQRLREMRKETIESLKLEARANFIWDIILTVGTKRLGPPSREVDEALWGTDDIDRLATLAARVAEAASWEELLAAP